MMKFSLSEGEGERTFVAAGAHYKITYENYQITGTWGPSSEDGKIPVELKISYYFKDWLDVDLKGVFDPVESSLRGTTTSMGTEGEFVFKRDSDLVRFCSAPSVTDARKRWEFVKILTLDRVRRQAWSSKQILKGIKDRRRFIELTLKDYYGRFMTWDEMLESAALSFGLREEDVRVCASIINIRLSKTVQFSYVVAPEPYRLAILTVVNGYQAWSPATIVAPVSKDRGSFVWTAPAEQRVWICVRSKNALTPRLHSETPIKSHIYQAIGCSRSTGSFSTETERH